MTTPKILATDLDGTFIPLAGHPENVFSLLEIERAHRRGDFQLVFVTGRTLLQTQDAIRSHGLPFPDVLIADVGTSIYRRDESERWRLSQSYAATLGEVAAATMFEMLSKELSEWDGLRRQGDSKQGPWKLSFHAEHGKVSNLAAAVRERIECSGHACDVIDGIDPFSGDGLIDIVPRGVSKAFAVDWWCQRHDLSAEEIVFAGDSRNDLAALTAGYRAVVVGNASGSVLETVRTHHQSVGWDDRLYQASELATTGVLAGARHFGLLQESVALGGARDGARALFAVWAPEHEHVDVIVEASSGQTRYPLQKKGGVHRNCVTVTGSNVAYGFSVDGGPVRPDPRSRVQPNGVHELSSLCEASDFAWSDQHWAGVARDDLVIYELHVGTFTTDGTYRAAVGALDDLVDLGVTAIELLPVAACPGRWNWGYDGVHLFAPSMNYGTPDDLRALVDAAHARGLAVFLDVVYNHLGPEGNYLAEFGPYFSSRHRTPWGDGLNFDGAGSDAVRDFFVDNVLYWLDEFHLDGLRLDAVHAIVDASQRHILRDIRRAVSSYASAVPRTIHLVAETNLYDGDLLTEDDEVEAYDLIWCDDLMHAVYSQLSPASKHTVRPYNAFDDIVECLRRGYLYQGLPETRADRSDASIRREDLVIALQNHDVVGNDPHGRRIHQLASHDAQRVAASLFLLQPSVPLIFMGEDRAAESPFHFFADFTDPSLRQAVEEGRMREYPSIAGVEAVPPCSDRAFKESRLQFGDTKTRSWYQRLISLRREMREAGVLATDALSVDAFPSQFAIRVRYSVCGCRYFVVVRLDVQEGAKPLPIAVDGVLLADSEAPDAESLPATVRSLHPLHAVVGSGDCELVCD